MFFTAYQVGNFARIVYNTFVCQTIAKLKFYLYCGVLLVRNPFGNINGRPRLFLHLRGNIIRPCGQMGQRVYSF